jgi:hypothetical protein
MVLDSRPPRTRPRSRFHTVVLFALFPFAAVAAARAQAPANAFPVGAALPAGRTDGAPTARRGSTPERSRTVKPGHWPRLHLPDPIGRRDARNALDLAWERLAGTECAGVTSTFTDEAGRPLDERLRAVAVDLQTYLTMLVFIDGSREAPCVTGVVAFTTPGSRVIRLCVDALKLTWQQDREHSAASFIHELLHTLGLGENPPSSAEITKRVLAACRRRR